MSRIGKIARLPKPIREELNRRLEDGEQQSRLVEWLNGRPEVQAVLPPAPGYGAASKAGWEDRPINESNMTAWVKGGFEDWRRQEESRAAADRLVEETAAVADAIARQETGVGGQATGVGCLVDRVATMAALAMAEQLMAIRRMEDGTEKRRAVLKIVRGLVRLRKSERDCERAQREASSFAKASAYAEATADKSEGTGGRTEAISGVRARMAEVLSEMSDEEIAEILRKGGYMSPAEPSSFAKPTADTTAGRPAEPRGTEDGGQGTEEGEQKPRLNPAFVEAWAPDGTWWSDEDEAACQAEEEAASRQAQAKRDVWSGTDGERLRLADGGQASTSTSAQTEPDASGQPPSPGEGEQAKPLPLPFPYVILRRPEKA